MSLVPHPDTLLTWGTGGLSVGIGLYAARMVGSGVRWLIVYFTDRVDKKEAGLDQQEERLNKRLEEQIERLTERLDKVEKELIECRRMHAEERAERLKLEALMLAKGEIKQQAQMIAAADKLDAKLAKEPKS